MKATLETIATDTFDAHGMGTAVPAHEREEGQGYAEHDPGAFFQNRACPYFPCHGGVDERQFNCLLCYCPLYALGPRCGGNFSYTGEGVKNCTYCTVPHEGTHGVDLVKRRFPELAALAAREDGAL